MNQSNSKYFFLCWTIVDFTLVRWMKEAGMSRQSRGFVNNIHKKVSKVNQRTVPLMVHYVTCYSHDHFLRLQNITQISSTFQIMEAERQGELLVLHGPRHATLPAIHLNFHYHTWLVVIGERGAESISTHKNNSYSTHIRFLHDEN